MRHTASRMISLLCVFLAGFALGEENESQPKASAVDFSRIAREEEKLILQALSRRITFECEDTSIDDALAKISQLIDCPILIDASRIHDERISMAKKVSLKMGEVTARQTLHFLLDPFHLTWVANDGVLEITTQANAAEVFVTRVYDVHHLCKLLEPLTRDMLFRPAGAKNPPARGVGGGFFSVPTNAISLATFGQFGRGGLGGPALPQAKPVPMVQKSVEATLAGMIVDCTSLKWVEREGNGGSVQLGQACLIICQTYHGQFEIAGMLKTLERFVGGKVQGKSIAVRRIDYPAEDDAKIFETLAKPLTVELEVQTLDQALGLIAREAGIRIWIDQVSLIDEGIEADPLVSPRRKMQKLPLVLCLKKILEPFQLASVVDEGVLVITSQSRAAEMMTLQFYDIGRISKIANEGPNSAVDSVLTRSAYGRWRDVDGEGGAASQISPRHLAVRQTQKVHTEIELLIDDLSKEELVIPVDPPLELRVYTAPDADTARDLERVIPQLLEARWASRGSIRQAGASLLVNQPSTVHDRLDEIMEKLEESHLRKNPPAKEPSEPKTLENAGEQKK